MFACWEATAYLAAGAFTAAPKAVRKCLRRRRQERLARANELPCWRLGARVSL